MVTAKYLNKNCNDCNNPLQLLPTEDGYVAECVSCLKKHFEIDDLSYLQKLGLEVLTTHSNVLPIKRNKPICNTQLIDVENGKKLSISRSGKFYFTQIVEGDKKTPLRPFCSLAEAAEIYPIINNTKITI